MSTFNNPAADAAEASAALRGLAHATRALTNPADLQGVLGDVLGGVRSLQQVLEQLATAHDSHRPRARDDDGDIDAGARLVFTASSELFDAALTLDQVEAALNLAAQASWRIVWQTPEERPDQRYVSVVFLQDEHADQALRMLREEGPAATVNHLAGRDNGDETTQAALSNGYVYDALPLAQFDELHLAGQYTMIINPAYRYVSLLRDFTPKPDLPSEGRTTRAAAELEDTETRLSASRTSITSSTSVGGISSVRRERMQGSWFEHPRVAEVKRLRGLQL